LCFVNEEIKDSIAADIPETEIAHEIKRFEHMIRSVAKELESAVERLNEENYLEEAEILKTHVYMVKDKHFLKKVIEKIINHGVAAHIAVEHALQEITAMFEQSDNAYISERKADFKDIAGQLIKKLHREDKEIFQTIMQTVEKPIIVIPELLPPHLLEARDSRVAGFVVTKGTSLSHAAIFAKSFGLPVLKLKNFYDAGLKNRMEVFLDGYEGRIFLNPSEIQVKEYVKPEEKTVAIKPLPLNVQINIIAPEQVNENILKKTNGIGLYRTEYLFMSQEDDFPSEEDQYRVYSSLFEKCMNVTMTARTLDVGADKELSYFSLGPQENPYLGFRAHRVYRFHPEIFITQVKAMLRAARKSKDFILLYPMIESTDDLSFVQDLLCQAIDAFT
jgi:phosphoenolpyruvate-protein phosphotransferase (PTS system enzyme I)